MAKKLKLSTARVFSFLDQTPTPLEDINLFNELIKNPFDDAFKKATEDNGLLDLCDGTMITTDTLNTPVPLYSNSPTILNLFNEETINKEDYQSKKNSLPQTKIDKSRKKIVSIRPANYIPCKINSNENILANDSKLDQLTIQYVPIYVTALNIPNIPNLANTNANLTNILPNGPKNVKQILKESIYSTKLRKSLFPNIYFPPPKSQQPEKKISNTTTCKKESNIRKEILERNREASARCRFKKKIQLQNLARTLSDIQKQNKILQKEVRKLRKTNEELRNENEILKNINAAAFIVEENS